MKIALIPCLKFIICEKERAVFREFHLAVEGVEHLNWLLRFESKLNSLGRRGQLPAHSTTF